MVGAQLLRKRKSNSSNIMAPKKKLPKKEEFEVERIVGDKYVGGKRYFFIKWKNFSSKNNTWEPEENLKKCSSLIRGYFGGKGLRNSKKNTLSTTLLRSLRVSKQRRASINSLISISSPKSSRKLIVSIEPVDVNVCQKQDKLNWQPGKPLENSVKDPSVRLFRMDEDFLAKFTQNNSMPPELPPQIACKPSVVEDEARSTQRMNESDMTKYSPGNTLLSDESNVSLSVKLTDESQLNECSYESPQPIDDSKANQLSTECAELTMTLPTTSSYESNDSKSDFDKTEINFVPTNNTLPVSSSQPVLNEDLDDIEDSDEELLRMSVFDVDKDEEDFARRPTKKRKRRKY